MFEDFSANFSNLLAKEEYQVTAREPFRWISQKVEMSTLIAVSVVDNVQLGWSELMAIEARQKLQAGEFLGHVAQVAMVYVLVGGEKPSWDGTEEYFGQACYSVFWHVDGDTGAVSAPKGQPRKLFRLEGMVKAAHDGLAAGNAEALEFRHKAASHRPLHRMPIATGAILAANAVVLLLMYMAGYPDDFLVPLRFGAILPYKVWEHGEWYRLFTAMFVHFGVAHLGANAFGLLVFASRAERYFGRVKFCVMYVVSGLVGSGASLLFSQAYSAGASGAVYGVIGALFAYTRVTRRSIEGISWHFMAMFILFGLAAGGVMANIDNAGHIGGLLGGAAFGAAFGWFGKKE
ncbi:MAG: rhomboid family intramembrane serine protease [Defluviitaleaceae bacterium]|nr:rhomboid family intramembrane serine protease [Defluviitaleaceae bacterium]